MATTNLLKCACQSCLCIVSTDDSVQKEGKFYCSEACAQGHETQKGCAQTAACNC